MDLRPRCTVQARTGRIRLTGAGMKGRGVARTVGKADYATRFAEVHCTGSVDRVDQLTRRNMRGLEDMMVVMRSCEPDIVGGLDDGCMDLGKICPPVD